MDTKETNRRILFIKEWIPIGYCKIMQYIKYILTSTSIPFTELEKVSDIEKWVETEKVTLGLIIISFDLIAAKGFPSFKNIQYLGVYMDPVGNLSYYWNHHKDTLQNVYGSIVPFMNQHDYFREKFPAKPIFSFYQGYAPHEDFKESVNPTNKTVDVLAPGFDREGVPDRLEMVKELRRRGLTVMDNRMFGNELDDAMKQCKVAIYYPLFNTITTFHGQRTLLAVNKQICVVTTESADRQTEQFYSSHGDIYIKTSHVGISQFCDVVEEVIKTGRWRHQGVHNYETYKQNYDGIEIFDKCLLKFFRDFTCNLFPFIDPLDDKYRIGLTRPEIPIMFTPFRMTTLATPTVNYVAQLTDYVRTKHMASNITSYASIRQAYDVIWYVLNHPTNQWSRFDAKQDRAMTTKLFTPKIGVEYDVVSVANGSFNIGSLDVHYQTVNRPVKLIFLVPFFGIPIDMKEWQTVMIDHETRHGFRPMLLSVHSVLANAISIVPLCSESAVVVWPSRYMFDIASSVSSVPITNDQAHISLTWLQQRMEQTSSVIQRYKQMHGSIQQIIDSFESCRADTFPFCLCVLPDNLEFSDRFPILCSNVSLLIRFQAHLKSYNIESEINHYGISLPCHITDQQFDELLDIVEEFFEVM